MLAAVLTVTSGAEPEMLSFAVRMSRRESDWTITDAKDVVTSIPKPMLVEEAVEAEVSTVRWRNKVLLGSTTTLETTTCSR